MQAVVGDLPDLSRTGMGMFTPGSPFASDAGMDDHQRPSAIPRWQKS